MTDIDTLVRRGLSTASVDAVAPTSPERAVALVERARSRRRSRRGVAVAAVAATVLAVVGAAVAITVSDADRVGVVADDPTTSRPSPTTHEGSPGSVTTFPGTTTPPEPVGPEPGGEAPAPDPTAFAGLTAGWHDLDPGPVPAIAGSGITWTGRDVVIVIPSGEAWAYEPHTATWRAVATAPPMVAPVDLVWTGREVVAVGSGPQAASAAWDPVADAWRSLGPVPTAPWIRSAMGTDGPGREGALYWTGERVVDVGRMTVLDPDGGTWETAPSLDRSILEFVGLLTAVPAVVDGEVVIVSYQGPGIVLDPVANRWRYVAGPSEDDIPAFATDPQSVSVADGDGGLLLIADRPGSGRPGRVLRYDVAADRWTDRGELEAIDVDPLVRCPSGAWSVAGTIVVGGCGDGPMAVLRAGGWSGEAPPEARYGAVTVAEGALVAWSAGDQPPRLQVWLP